MIKTGKLTLLAAILVPGMAFAQINVGDTLGDTETAIVAALESKGYTPNEVEIEDGEIEVEITKDGQDLEIEISTDTGMVVAIYIDDDDDEIDHEDDDEDEND